MRLIIVFFESFTNEWGIMRFRKKGKLCPLYVGLYKILKRVGKVAYELVLPPTLEAIHTFFHIFLLKKNVGDLKSIIPLECVDVMYSITYEEVSVEILDERLRNKEVDLVKGLCRSQSLEGPI